MKTIKNRGYYLLLLLTTYFIHGQNSIVSDIDASSIEDFSYVFKNGDKGYLYQFLKDSTSQDAKIFRAFHTSLEISPGNSAHYDNEILSAITLKPLRKYFGKNAIHFDYAKDDEIDIAFSNSDTTITKTIKTEKFVFIVNGPGIYLLLQALPLKVGYHTTLLGIKNLSSLTKDLDTVPYSIKVIGEESINYNSESMDCYIVEINSLIPNTGFYAKFWCRKEKPHLPIQSIFTLSKNKSKISSSNIIRPWKILKL